MIHTRHLPERFPQIRREASRGDPEGRERIERGGHRNGGQGASHVVTYGTEGPGMSRRYLALRAADDEWHLPVSVSPSFSSSTLKRYDTTADAVIGRVIYR